METITKLPTLIPRLREFDVFQQLPGEALQWLTERSDYVCYDPGDVLFRPGDVVDHMQIIVEGSVVFEQEQNGETRELGVWQAGYITGVLPFSRMTEAKARGRALERCCVLELHRRYFTEMVNVSYELTQALVSVMTTRVRDFTSIRFQNEKLMALGKLSAGLAHELNNPAAAMVRDAEELYKRQHQTPERFKAIMAMQVTAEQTDQVNAILFERMKNLNALDLSTMERLDRLEELQDWLDDHDISDAEDAAETFVDFGVTTGDLDRIDAIVNGRHLNAIVRWLESSLSLEKLVTDIRESAGRINGLIQSIKQYSHMDRGVSLEPVNLYDGIRSTLIMLQHSLKKKNIRLVKHFEADLPPLPAYAGELNQVWTNLFSNAIDAMEKDGTLTIRAYRERNHLCVEVEDTGSGIPEENLTRIFDPFFTTKPMGEGTGMGLDIVKRIIDRHRGDIQVRSQPGQTVFTLCFPLQQKDAPN